MHNIIKEGHGAFYDDTPRYKNPYEGDESELWFSGWDSGEQEHRLFTENQEMKEKISSLEGELKEKNSFLQRNRVDIDTILTNCIDIDIILANCMYYLDNTGVIRFRREKMKSYLGEISGLIEKSKKTVL